MVTSSPSMAVVGFVHASERWAVVDDIAGADEVRRADAQTYQSPCNAEG